jgi:NADP-reducing hydrogenase subunit HndC
LYEVLEKITSGNGTMEDVEGLSELCDYICNNSLCGLGQTAPNPVKSTLRYFMDEYIAHVKDKKCPAGVCADLLMYKIIDEKCKRCTLCIKVCPVDAITGAVKEKHTIDTDKCVKCGVCVDKCKFGAIVKE